MPTEDERPENAPDTSETYERGHPEKEPGLGEMDEPDRKPDHRQDDNNLSTSNPEDPPELAGEDDRDGGDTVDPASDTDHAGRPDPAQASEDKEQA